MAIFYPFPTYIPVWQVLGASLLIIIISVAVIAMAKRMPYLFIGWSWYAITLLPVIKIVQVGNDAMADRYHYLPSIGLTVMLAWGIPSLIKSENSRKKILFPAGIAVLAILAVIARQQCTYWKNSTSVFSHAVQVTKDNYLAHTNLASALAEEENFNKAIYHYNKAIQIDPYIPINYENRGKAYAGLDKHQLAIDDFNKVISLNANYAETYYNRGTSYGKTRQYQLAINDFNKVISLKPDNIKAYNNRGIVHLKLNLYQKAIDDFNEAIRLKPDYADAFNNRGAVYLKIGKNELGCRDAKKACELGVCKVLATAKSKGDCH
jgi:tetratricopeptide (TPR) repeat protein